MTWGSLWMIASRKEERKEAARGSRQLRSTFGGLCERAKPSAESLERRREERTDRGTALVVLLLRDPHLLEGREGREDGSSDPDGVLPLRGSNNLDLRAFKHERPGPGTTASRRRTFIDEGASAVISFCIRSEIPAYLIEQSRQQSLFAPGGSKDERTWWFHPT